MQIRSRAWFAAMAMVGATLGTPGVATAATQPTHAAPTTAQPSRAATAAQLAQPNIVVILTDDQPVGLLDAMPQVSALLRDRGVNLDHAMVPTALCTPSRASLLTGRFAHETGVYRNSGSQGGWHSFVGSGLESQTLPVWLHDAGYRTALVGKYLNGFNRSDPGYAPPGWDTFSTRVAGGPYYDYTLRTASDGAVQQRVYGSRPQDYSTDVFADLAVSEIGAAPVDQPLFLLFAPNAPHSPFTPAPRHVGAWSDPVFLGPDFNEADMSDKPAWLRDERRRSAVRMTTDAASQRESLMAVDDAVGRIVAALGDRAADTLFVFASDNGLMLGSHRLWSKSVAYRRSLEVPLILRWDGRLPAGTTDSRIALNVDVTATVLDAAGVAEPTSGVSLLAPPARTGFVVEAAPAPSIGRPAYCGWRTRRWLFVQYSHHAGRELYDYRTDPLELTNLGGDPSLRERRLSMGAEAAAACDPVPPRFTW